MRPAPITNRLLILADRPEGVTTAEATGSDPTRRNSSSGMLSTLAARGELFKLKEGRAVRYFRHQDQLLAYSRSEEAKARRTATTGVANTWIETAPVRVVRGRAPFAIDPELAVTPRTVYTVCPSHNPVFSERETPNVYGGGQCGRVVRDA